MLSQASNRLLRLYTQTAKNWHRFADGIFKYIPLKLNGCIFSCNQAALWMGFSARISVFVSHTIFTMFPSTYHHEIFKSFYQWQGWWSTQKVKVRVNGQGHRGQNPTQPFSDGNSSLNSQITIFHSILKRMTHKAWCYRFSSSTLKFQGHTAQRSSTLTQIGRFRTVTPVLIQQWLRNDTKRREVANKKCPIVFQDHPSNFKVTRLKKIIDFDPNWDFPDCNSSFNSTMAKK